MNITKFIMLCFLVLVLAVGAHGQAEESNSSDSTSTDVRLIDFSIDINSPILDFGEVIDGSLYGFTFGYFKQREAKQYSFFGTELAFAHIGALSNTVVTAGFSDFNDRTSSNFVSLKFIYRYFSPVYLKNIEPFLDVGLGPAAFYTQTTTTFLDDSGASEVDFDQIKLGLNYSLGVGTMIKIYNQLFGMIKFNYNGGSSISFLVPTDELNSELPIDSFLSEKTQTNYLKLQLGVSFAF